MPYRDPQLSTETCTNCGVTYTSVKGSKVDVAKLCRPCYEIVKLANELSAEPLLKWIKTDASCIT